ncbi:MAG: DNA mismatch repair endonuclease MutL [Nanoarchaeota archaeon]
MGNIKVLDDMLVNKIAAGEVVEKPASIVKELIENAIDSDANFIEIKLKEGGLSQIKITDNGKGMDKEDLQLSILRHSTSKIKNSQDLFKINTLGFRGEALASIAAISRLSITSKIKKNEHANRLINDNGITIEETYSNQGTIVDVKDIFYNTPARKKYLRSIEKELSDIIDIVSKYALAYPEIHFRLINDSKQIINSLSTKKILQNLSYIYPANIVKEMIPVNNENQEIKISGYISPPQITRSDKNYQTIFVNGRYVKNKIIRDAIYQGYHSMLFTRRHPIVFLNIDIDSEEIDVNVHPSKEIIKFSKEKKIFEVIKDSIYQALSKNDLSPKFEEKEYDKKSFQKELISENKKKYSTPILDKRIGSRVEKKQRYGFNKEIQSNLDTNKIETVEKKTKDYRILGQINKEYIIIQNIEGLLIVDQHAAQERTNYEKFLESKATDAIKTQSLLEPKMISLEPKKSVILQKRLDLLKRIGVNIVNFGDNDFILKSVPVIFRKIQKEEFIQDIIDTISKNKNNSEEMIEEKIIRMSCRASVKAGDELTIPEMEKIYEEMLECKNPYTCPHGRPTVIRLTLEELEKKFKRV